MLTSLSIPIIPLSSSCLLFQAIFACTRATPFAQIVSFLTEKRVCIRSGRLSLSLAVTLITMGVQRWRSASLLRALFAVCALCWALSSLRSVEGQPNWTAGRGCLTAECKEDP
jgi:hypothetical protein